MQERSGVAGHKRRSCSSMASAKTEDKNAFTFLWRIEKFSYWDRECHGEKIVSPAFSDTLLLKHDAKLHLFPKGSEEGDEHLRVHLSVHPKLSLLNVTVNCELSFLDDSGSAITTGVIRNHKMEKDMPLDLPDCPRQEEVFQSKRSSFLPHDTLTVRCRLWRTLIRSAPPQHVYARSRIDVREASIVLRHGFLKTIELDQKKDCVLSFHGLSRDDLSCIYSLTGSSLSNAAFSLKMVRINFNGPLDLTCKLSLLNTEGKTIRCIEGRHKFYPSFEPQIWDIPHFLTRKELLDNCDIDSISTKIMNISENTVIMNGEAGMEFVFPKDDIPTLSDSCIQVTQQTIDQHDTSQQIRDSVTILGEDLLSIYKDQTMFDFELRSGGVSFRVHKNVLCARSPVFRAMFCGDMREVKSTSLDIPDVDAHTLNQMLTFLYAGTVDDLQWDGAAKLYYAADKYQVLSLKEECSSLLRSSIGVSNVCDVLALAVRHQDDELISFVHNFILSHYDEILLSDEWDKFLDSDPHFAGRTMKHVYKTKLQLKSQ